MTNVLLRNPCGHRAVFQLRGVFHLKPLFQYLSASPVSPVSLVSPVSRSYVSIPIVTLYLLTLLHLLYTIIHASFLKDSSDACRMITVLPSMCTVSAHIMRSAVIKTAYEIFINCFFRSLPGQFHRFGDIESCETSEPILSHRDCRDRTIKSAMGDNNG